MMLNTIFYDTFIFFSLEDKQTDSIGNFNLSLLNPLSSEH